MRKRIPLKTAIIIEIVVIVTVAAFFLPGGDDLYRFYLPFARGCLTCGFTPYHASWILFPLTLIPPRLLWPVWVLFTLLAVVWACGKLGVDARSVLLSFPMLGQLWLGQVDGLLVIGLALAVTGTNPYLRGIGLLLCSIKPQVTGPAVLVLLWYDRQRWKALLIPAGVFLVSLLVWGWDWPLRWLVAQNTPPLHVWRMATLFPIGLVAFLTIFLLKKPRQKITAALLASAVGFPFYGVYSYVVFLVFLAPWWSVPVSYAWLVGYPWWGNTAMRLAWILPVSLLLYLLRHHYSRR